MALSKSQIDKLGDRLKAGHATEEDLRVLDEYRRTFGAAYDEVVANIRDDLRLEPTGRPAKSTPSIVEKVRRESIRLSQIQDIAGCRLVTADVVGQDLVIESLKGSFTNCAIVDRRRRPSHGYRAVHVITRVHGRAVEIQIRTTLQHQWAELSEKYSDLVDPALKYGTGVSDAQELLGTLSQAIATAEFAEARIAGVAEGSDKQKLQNEHERYKMGLLALFDHLHADVKRRERNGT